MSTEIERRRRAVNSALASTEMAGGTVSLAARAIAEQYVAGEITLEEVSAGIRAIWQRPEAEEASN